MKSTEIRKKFFDFFHSRAHTIVSSSSLIPAHNPTLLFTNAGMNQFTDLFLGLEKRSYTRAVSIQKCVRAGGKHNDLENVGFTKRHLTFFEMMGNFSFGDYFKKDAIHFAWDFLTQEMHLPIEKLHATVYKTDDEAYELWHKAIGIPQERMHRLGEKENFWQMGDTGPCGPCTEIHIDRGPSFGCKEISSCGPACDCDRFLEIWNLVFMQYDRQADGTDKPLKQTGVDTGMGLERLTSVVQNVDSVYETDLFANIIQRTQEITNKKYNEQSAALKAAFNVLADHIRSSTMLIADGCAPSNEGRGYVLRKIIRRAALFAQKLTDDASLFPELSKVVIDDFQLIYPELSSQQEIIYKILDSEVKKFSTNLIRGQSILSTYFEQIQDSKIITGPQAFKLYDTFGFPIELTKVIAHERGYDVDTVGFETAMTQQQEQSSKHEAQPLHVDLDETIVTEFTGYKELETESEIIALVQDSHVVDGVPAGQQCYVIAKKSPFFIVGGGQVPDKGWLQFDAIRVPHQEVRYINNAIAALIEAPVDLKIGQKVTSIVNEPLRIAAMKNHTATHMLQSALINLFGNQIKQSGSLVHPDYLRFDFTYHENLSASEIKKVEDMVNEKIRENIPLNVEYTTLKDAQSRGALAFFGDKYKPEKVRIVEIPHFSAELCGGTHVKATGDIGTFKIVEVSALSAGHRRIVAVTGKGAINLFQECFDSIRILSQEFKCKREEIIGHVHKQQETIKELHCEIKQLKRQVWQSKLPEWAAHVETVGNTPYLFVKLEDVTNEDLREIAHQLQTKKPGFYCLASITDDKMLLLCSLAQTLRQQISLKNFAQWLKESHNIRSGGSDIMIQGGAAHLDPNLSQAIKEWLEKY